VHDPELERDEATSLWLRNLGDLELVGLWESLPGASSTGTLMDDVVSAGDGEAIIFSLPENFLDAITAIEEAAVAKVAAAWSKIDGLAAWNLSDLADVIRNIRRLVREARANDQVVVQLA